MSTSPHNSTLCAALWLQCVQQQELLATYCNVLSEYVQTFETSKIPHKYPQMISDLKIPISGNITSSCCSWVWGPLGSATLFGHISDPKHHQRWFDMIWWLICSKRSLCLTEGRLHMPKKNPLDESWSRRKGSIQLLFCDDYGYHWVPYWNTHGMIERLDKTMVV